MSLKTFHVVFITCAVALALLFAIWAGTTHLAIAIASVIVAAGLVRYERAFLRRCRRLGLS